MFLSCKKKPQSPLLFPVIKFYVNGQLLYTPEVDWRIVIDTNIVPRGYRYYLYGSVDTPNTGSSVTTTGFITLMLYSNYLTPDSELPTGIYKSIGAVDSCLNGSQSCNYFQFFYIPFAQSEYIPGTGFSNNFDASGTLEILPYKSPPFINGVFNCTVYDSTGLAKFKIDSGSMINIPPYNLSYYYL